MALGDEVGVLEVFSNLSGSVVPCAVPALPHPDPTPSELSWGKAEPHTGGTQPLAFFGIKLPAPFSSL